MFEENPNATHRFVDLRSEERENTFDRPTTLCTGEKYGKRKKKKGIEKRKTKIGLGRLCYANSPGEEGGPI